MVRRITTLSTLAALCFVAAGAAQASSSSSDEQLLHARDALAAGSHIKRHAAQQKRQNNNNGNGSGQSSSRTRTGGGSTPTTAPSQGGGAAGGAAGGASPGLLSFTGSFPPSVLSIVATISSGANTVLPTYPLHTTPAAGARNTYISNAPPLPAVTALPVASYPPLDQPPPVNSPEVQGWLAKMDFSKVPSAPVNYNIDCSNASNPNVANARASGNCWWTCGGCTRDSDVTTCPTKNDWGASWDDGPSPYTPLLLDYFDQNQIKATFFVVGSRVLSRPQMLQAEYASGHQISVHTWSHTALTTQTNEQIVAELGWTRKVIKDVLGVSPNTMRAPYGDLDDRVRAIALQMGLTPIQWTTSPQGLIYDTNDWKIGAGTVSAANSAYAFEQIIRNGPNLNTGYIVLAHDLYEQSVDLSIKVILPFVQQFTPKQSLMPIVQCLGKNLADAYVETANNQSAKPSGTFASAVGAPSAGGIAAAAATSGSSSSSSSGKSAAAPARSAELLTVALVSLTVAAGFTLL